MGVFAGEPPTCPVLETPPFETLTPAMRTFYINEQKRHAREHGQSAPFGRALAGSSAACTSALGGPSNPRRGPVTGGVSHCLVMLSHPVTQEIEHARMLKQIAEAVRPRHSNPGTGSGTSRAPTGCIAKGRG